MADEERIDTQEEAQETSQASPTTTNPQAPPPTGGHEHRNQWLKFGILALILFGTVVVIAMARPLIFGHVVPAVMGDTSVSSEEAVPEAAPPAAGEGDTEVFIPAASSGDTTGEGGQPVEAVEGEGEGGGETAVSEPSPQPTTEPTPEPTAAPITHTVQSGDNLTKIAQQYGVTVQDIMTANNLLNADYIAVGQVLIIPTN